MEETTDIAYPATSWSDLYSFSGRFCCPECHYRPHPDTSARSIIQHLQTHNLAFVAGVGLVRETPATADKRNSRNADCAAGGLLVSRITQRHGRAWYTLK